MKAELIGKKIKSRRGQGTLELIIALAILALGASSAVTVFFQNQTFYIDSELNDRAIFKAEKILEESRALSRQNFNNLVSQPPVVEDGYTKKVEVIDLNPCKKMMTVDLEWKSDFQRAQKIQTSTLLTDWRLALIMPDDTCTNEPNNPEYWRCPYSPASAGGANGAKGIAIDVFKERAYVTTDHNNKDDFYIFNVDNIYNPIRVSSLRATHVGNNKLNAIKIAEVTGRRYAFVASSENDKSFKIIDVENENNPLLIFNDSSVLGINGVGLSIFFRDSRVYLGTSNKLFIIDVADPYNPLLLDSMEIGAAVKAIYVRNQFAYLATSDLNQQLKILNLNNPIQLIGSYRVLGGGSGQSIFLLGNKIYLGLSSGNRNFLILDVTNPASVSLLGSIATSISVNEIFITNNLAFLITDSQPNNEFQVWNVADPGQIIDWDQGYQLNLPNLGKDFDYENNVIYAVFYDNEVLKIIIPSLTPCS